MDENLSCMRRHLDNIENFSQKRVEAQVQLDVVVSLKDEREAEEVVESETESDMAEGPSNPMDKSEVLTHFIENPISNSNSSPFTPFAISVGLGGNFAISLETKEEDEEYSRICANNVFGKIPDTEIGLKLEHSAKTNLVNTNTQVLDENFQPNSSSQGDSSDIIMPVTLSLHSFVPRGLNLPCYSNQNCLLNPMKLSIVAYELVLPQ